MKHAFTMVELIFVIILLGILSVVALPRLAGQDEENVQAATDQLIRHIRYTQHLAMNDDPYIPHADFSEIQSDNSPDTTKSNHAQQWFNGRWQIVFHVDTTGGLDASNRNYQYSIFRDIPWWNGDSYDRTLNNPVDSASFEYVAIDPLTRSYMTYQDWNGNTPDFMSELDVLDTYGVRIDMTDARNVGTGLPSWNSAPRLLFDTLGRPYYYTDDTTNPYTRLMTDTYRITLKIDTDNSISTTICVEPLTGFTHQCD